MRAIHPIRHRRQSDRRAKIMRYSAGMPNRWPVRSSLPPTVLTIISAQNTFDVRGNRFGPGCGRSGRADFCFVQAVRFFVTPWARGQQTTGVFALSRQLRVRPRQAVAAERLSMNGRHTVTVASCSTTRCRNACAHAVRRQSRSRASVAPGSRVGADARVNVCDPCRATSRRFTLIFVSKDAGGLNRLAHRLVRNGFCSSVRSGSAARRVQPFRCPRHRMS